MKTSIAICAIFCCIQLAFAGTPTITPTITPQLDTFPKEPTFGLTLGFLNNGSRDLGFNAYQFGFITEIRNTSFYATEIELSSEYRRVNFQRRALGRRNEVNLNLAVNSKIYLGKYKDTFYVKLGFFANRQVWDDGGEDFRGEKFDRDFTTGLQFGVGHLWHFGPNTTNKLRLEPLISWVRDEGFSAGFKIGYLF